MSWLRTDDGFSAHPKFSGWKPAQKWAFLELMHYCARYRTEGVIPDDLTLLPRSIDTRLLTLAEESGWVERDAQNRMVIHDWHVYNPKDATAASRMQAYRNRNATRNDDRNDDRNETVSRAQARAEPVPSPKKSSLSQRSTADHEKRERGKISEAEQARQAAWQERAKAPDIDSPAAFVAYGIRSGNWPDPYEPKADDKRRERAIENGSGSGPAYLAGLIQNGVLTERRELEAELDLAGLEGDERAQLVALFDRAAVVEVVE